MSEQQRLGAGWAYGGTVVGGAGSLAANVAHCFIPPPDAGPGWRPEAGAVLSAVFWPVALFVAVEILVRTPWPVGRWWKAARFGGLLPVALVAAVVSYRHLSGLLDHYHEDALTVLAGPAAVDGLMVMAAAALLASSRHRPPTVEVPEPEVAAVAVVASVPAEPPPRELPPVPAPRVVGGAIPSGVIR